MRRKPAIILFLLVFLSMGGAVLYHQLRKDPRPPFIEVDAFLRRGPLPANWRFVEHRSQRSGRLNSDWSKWLGVRRTVHYRVDSYHYLNDRTSHQASIYVNRKDEEIVRMEIAAGAMYMNAFRDAVFGKFPELLPYDANFMH